MVANEQDGSQWVRRPGLLKVDSRTAEVMPFPIEGLEPIRGSVAFRRGVLCGKFQKSKDLVASDTETQPRLAFWADLFPGCNTTSLDSNATGLLHIIELMSSVPSEICAIDPDTCSSADVGRTSESVSIVGSLVWNPTTGKFLGSSLSGNLFDLDIDGAVNNKRDATPRCISRGGNVF